jgi:transcriptional regulator with XRE-family HTH domain
VPARRRAIDRAAAKASATILELEREIEELRRQHGLSLTDLGAAVGLSRWRVGRICAGRDPNLTIAEVARLMAALGSELAIRAYPHGEPVRDAAHLALLERHRSRLHGDLRWRTEVPVSVAGDLRAWDATVSGRDWVLGIEAETRVRDMQALLRRLALKARDGRVDGVILLLADTRHHRHLVALTAPMLREQFPTTGRRAVELLAVGARPPGSAVVLL